MILEVSLQSLLLSLLYIALIILVVVLIILAINMIKSVKNANILLNDFENKISKLDGVFNMVDNFSEAVSVVTDKITSIVSQKVNEIINKKKGNDKNE